MFNMTHPVIPLRSFQFSRRDLSLHISRKQVGVPDRLTIEGPVNRVDFIPVYPGHRQYREDQPENIHRYVPCPEQRCGWARVVVIHDEWEYENS